MGNKMTVSMLAGAADWRNKDHRTAMFGKDDRRAYWLSSAPEAA